MEGAVDGTKAAMTAAAVPQRMAQQLERLQAVEARVLL